MIATIAASAALMAGSALAGSLGSAVVVNKCPYDVHFCAVPASGGGQEQTDKILSTGDSWSQQWTALSNGAGWSLKMSKDGSFGENVLQYEYTYQNAATLWYDLSEVNGNPWNGDYEITADSQSGCTPRQAAYRYATDDAYGMQDCPVDSTITVTLCSGDDAVESGSGGNGGGSSAAPASSSSSAAPSPSPSSSSPPSYSAPASSSTSKAAPPSYSAPAQSSSNVQVPSSVSSFQTSYAAPSPSPADSSKASSASPVISNAPVKQQFAATTLVTVIETAYVTVDTTATATAWVPSFNTVGNGKRHNHAHNHAARHAGN